MPKQRRLKWSLKVKMNGTMSTSEAIIAVLLVIAIVAQIASMIIMNNGVNERNPQHILMEQCYTDIANMSCTNMSQGFSYVSGHVFACRTLPSRTSTGGYETQYYFLPEEKVKCGGSL
jgi:hypothetical protein